MLFAALMAMALDASGTSGAAEAAALGTLDTFKTLCVANEGDFSKAIAQADGMGWRQPGPRALADLPGSLVRMADGQIRATAKPDGAVLLVFSGRDVAAATDGSPGRNRVCGVVGVKLGKPDAEFRQDLERWAGSPPVRSNVREVAFVTETSAPRSNPSQLQKDFDAGKVKGVFALSPPDANILVYLIPTQAN